MQEMARELVKRLPRFLDCEVIARSDRDLPAAGVPVHGLLVNDLRGARRALISRAEPDVWLALNAGTAALAPHLSAPVVAYVNGNDFLAPWFGFESVLVRAASRLPRMDGVTRALRARAYRAQVTEGMRACRRIVANSANTRRLVEQALGSGAPPVSVVEPGISEAGFRDDRDGERRARVPRTPLRLLTVTRMSSASRRKNVDGMLRAVASLPEEVVSRYTLVGDGDDRVRFEALASELGVTGRVHFTGSLDRDALILEYLDADLFMLAVNATSHDVEGFGMVYVEASAVGLPVLASRAGGSTDAIVEGVNGLLVNDGSPEAIADGIRAVYEGRVAIDPAAARSVAERYRWSAVTERLVRELKAAGS